MKPKLFSLLALICLSFAASSAELRSFSQLNGILAGSKSIPDAISKLPAEHLGHYTLMQRSASLQGATPLSPRAILYGLTGRMIVTFNGDSGQSGYGELEVAEFDQDSRRIYFREIIFAPEAKDQQALKDLLKKLELEPGDYGGRSGPFVYTKPNPNKCMQCHAVDTRQFPFTIRHEQRLAKYIWSEYAIWQMPKVGEPTSVAYGVFDDEMGFANHAGEPIIEAGQFRSGVLPLSNYPIPKERSSNETVNYLKFRLKASKDERYKYLKYDEREFLGYPYHNNYVIDQLKGVTNAVRRRNLDNHMPNLRLSRLMGANFAAQMASVFMSDPLFKKTFPYLVADLCRPYAHLIGLSEADLRRKIEAARETYVRPVYSMSDTAKGIFTPEEDGLILPYLVSAFYHRYGNFLGFNVGNEPLGFNFGGARVAKVGYGVYQAIAAEQLQSFVVQTAVRGEMRSHGGFKNFLTVNPLPNYGYDQPKETREHLISIGIYDGTGLIEEINRCDGLMEAL